MVASNCQAFEECYEGLEKIYPGSQLQSQVHSLMISLLLKCSMQLTLCHVGFTVLKQFVLHVELLLHGQNLPMQKDLQTLCSFWRESIQQKNHTQIMFALTKLVWC